MKSACLALAILLSGCAVESPYPEWTSRPEPPPALSVPDVIKLLTAGISESAIFSHVRVAGILSRPSTAEIHALRGAGATEGFIAGLLAAAILYPEVPSPDPAGALRLRSWRPFHPVAELPPYLCWTWAGGLWHLTPRPSEPREVEP